MTLFATLNAKTGRVITEFHRRQRAREFRKFLDTIHAQVPASLAVRLILENSSTQKTAAIHCWLARHPPLSPEVHADRLVVDRSEFGSRR